MLSLYVRPIDDIRAEYSTPMKSKTANDFDCYCVGGAIIAAHKDVLATEMTLQDEDSSFPDNGVLATALHLLNPALRDAQAFAFAIAIIDWNDKGNFHMAWKTAKEALTYIPFSYLKKE